jgi:hypothetical protein
MFRWIRSIPCGREAPIATRFAISQFLGNHFVSFPVTKENEDQLSDIDTTPTQTVYQSPTRTFFVKQSP